MCPGLSNLIALAQAVISVFYTYLLDTNHLQFTAIHHHVLPTYVNSYYVLMAPITLFCKTYHSYNFTCI